MLKSGPRSESKLLSQRNATALERVPSFGNQEGSRDHRRPTRRTDMIRDNSALHKRSAKKYFSTPTFDASACT
jgi:hypothetical protein